MQLADDATQARRPMRRALSYAIQHGVVVVARATVQIQQDTDERPEERAEESNTVTAKLVWADSASSLPASSKGVGANGNAGIV